MNMKILWPVIALIVSFSCWTAGLERGKRQANRKAFYGAINELIDNAEKLDGRDYYAVDVMEMFDRFTDPKSRRTPNVWEEWLRLVNDRTASRFATNPASFISIFGTNNPMQTHGPHSHTILLENRP